MNTRTAIVFLIFGPALAACPDDESTAIDANVPSQDADASVPDAASPERPLSALVDVCPRPNATPVIGDSNGDGVMDLADAVALQNQMFRGGRSYVCLAASNFDGDSRVELDDAERVIMHLLTGEQNPVELGAQDCNDATPWPEGQCAPMALDILAPLRSNGGTLRAQVALRSPVLAVQGLSASLEASGCQIERVTTEGTIAADIWDQPPGIRHLGWAATPRVEGGAIAFLILSFTDDIYLPTASDPLPVLSLEISATAPSSGCAPCRISMRDGLTWRGQPINAAVAADGRAYVPALPNIEVEICAE